MSAVVEPFCGDSSRLVCRFRFQFRLYVRSVGKAVLIDSTRPDPTRLLERTVFRGPMAPLGLEKLFSSPVRFSWGLIVFSPPNTSEYAP